MENSVKEDAGIKQSWHQIIFKYNQPSTIRSVWQIINSVVPFLIIWYFMYQSLAVSYWITLALSILATGFSVRIFIIFHDCAHSSFFKSDRWNLLVGIFLGLFSFTPFYKWKRSHDGHHKTVGNLDKRGVGDVKTLTVEEYRNLSKGRRLFYTYYRHPIIMFLVGGLYVFLFQNRFTNNERITKERLNVHFTNLLLIIIIGGISWLIGFKAFVLIQLPIFFMSSALGVSLFYIQHQFEDVKWERQENWDYKTIALEGSSHFKLPKVLQWFTGNIGIHHIHHLSPRIPNYYLQKCLDENEEFQVKPITIRNSFKSLKLRLWDEERNRIIGFKALNRSDI